MMMMLCLLNKYLCILGIGHLGRQKRNDDIVFVKQVPMHLRDRRNRKLKSLMHPRNTMMQIARDNVLALIAGKFSFSPENLLNKAIIFDVSRVDEKI